MSCFQFGICLAALFFTFLLELCAFRLGIAYLGQQLGDYSSGPIRPPSRPAELEAGTNANPENDTDVKAINNTGKDESKVAPGEDVDPESGIDIKFKDSDESIPPSAQILGVAILEFGIVFHSVRPVSDSPYSSPMLTRTASSLLIGHHWTDDCHLKKQSVQHTIHRYHLSSCVHASFSSSPQLKHLHFQRVSRVSVSVSHTFSLIETPVSSETFALREKSS